MLHVLSGDEAARVFADAGVPGARLVWRDILVEGPVAAGDATAESVAARAAWLARRLGIDADAYQQTVREQAAGLAAAPDHDEVVLWFEQDLFCAVNLWSILDWFARRAPATRLALVYPPTDDVKGLGAMTGTRLAALFAARRPVGDAARELGAQAWAAYAGPDPLQGAPLIADETPPLPFVREAFRCHWGRFPSVANGLNEVETAALALLRRGPRRFGDLFREVSTHPRVRRHGLGDVQFAACVRGLRPLIDVAGHDVTTAELEITRRGREVAAGDGDWLELTALDTWLGGVHLRPGAPLWRWDGARGRLVTARP
jgi:hypothetical protein